MEAARVMKAGPDDRVVYRVGLRPFNHWGRGFGSRCLLEFSSVVFVGFWRE